MTQNEARQALRVMGVSLTKRDGEYRVAFPGTGQEPSAAYDSDLDSAVDTGVAMAAWNGNPLARAVMDTPIR